MPRIVLQWVLVFEAVLLLPGLLVGGFLCLLLAGGIGWSTLSNESLGLGARNALLAVHPVSAASSAALLYLLSRALRTGTHGLRAVHWLWWLLAGLVVPVVGLMLLHASYLPAPPQGQGDPRRLLHLQGVADVPCLIPLAHLLFLALAARLPVMQRRMDTPSPGKTA